MEELETLLIPIEGDNPSGENLRYEPVYDAIKEARREDDQLERGDWQRDIKTAEWDVVVKLATEALKTKTKDLQIAAWLTEAQIVLGGFPGLLQGLQLINGLMHTFWETLYPEIEDGDLDYRAAPIEFINDKLWSRVKNVPLTDPRATQGYSYVKWQESRKVGDEASIKNQYGNVDENKKRQRDEYISEGKITLEDFDAAVALSSKDFYQRLTDNIAACLEEFTKFDQIIDAKFGNDAPRLAELKEALEDCSRFAAKILKEKKVLEPDAEPASPPSPESGEAPSLAEEIPMQTDTVSPDAPMAGMPAVSAAMPNLAGATGVDPGSQETMVWQTSLKVLNTSGLQPALQQIYAASATAHSVRDKNRYRLMMAKLSLQANKPMLARPIAEELNKLVAELQLERWESPMWIAEVMDVLYLCLTSSDATDDDQYRAKDLLQKMCTIDVTKAMKYSK